MSIKDIDSCEPSEEEMMIDDSTNINAKQQLLIENDNNIKLIDNKNRQFKKYLFSTKNESTIICILILNKIEVTTSLEETMLFDNLIPINYESLKQDDKNNNSIDKRTLPIDIIVLCEFIDKNDSTLEVDILMTEKAFFDKQFLTNDILKNSLLNNISKFLECINTKICWKSKEYGFVCLECCQIFENKNKCHYHLINGDKHQLTGIEAANILLENDKNIVIYENNLNCAISSKLFRFDKTNDDVKLEKCVLPLWTTNNIICSSCDIAFQALTELDEHNKLVHSNLNEQINYTKPSIFQFQNNQNNNTNTLLSSAISKINSHASSNGSTRQQNREYRCTICNYKTVTKGNLHIHFQSEKHRNNQREHDQNEQRSINSHQNTHQNSNHQFQNKSINSTQINQQNTPIKTNESNIINPTPNNLANHLASLTSFNFIDTLLNLQKNHEKKNGGTNINLPILNRENPIISTNSGSNDNNNLPSFNMINMPIFECDICRNFVHSDIDVMLEHADRPRHLPSNAEVSKIVRVSSAELSPNINNANTEMEHICLLDGYKTRIKANFLLHFKTEKHQQKLQLLAHAREGGVENANKLIMQMVTEPTSLVSIRCNLCRATFSTPHKLKLHVDTHDHQINQKVASSFQLWQKSIENNVPNKLDLDLTFECKPCGLIFKRYIDILDHFHTQRNNLHMAYFKKELNLTSLIKIHYGNNIDSNNVNETWNVQQNEIVTLQCNLCNDMIQRSSLRKHLKEIHNISESCLDKMILMAETSTINNKNSELNIDNMNIELLKISEIPVDWADCVFIKDVVSSEPMVRCQLCGKCFATVPMLEEHRYTEKHNEPNDSRGYLCFKKGCNQYFNNFNLMIDHFYEIHAFQIHEYKRLDNFKYVCKICHLLAFSSPAQWTKHMNLHMNLNDGSSDKQANMTNCVVCDAKNENLTKLKLHIEENHLIRNEINKEIISEPISNNCRLNLNYQSRPNEALQNDNKSQVVESNVCFDKDSDENYNYEEKKATSPFKIDNLKQNDNLSGNFPLLTNAISDLLQSVGPENMKLVIETMINSRNKNSTDFTSTFPPNNQLNETTESIENSKNSSSRLFSVNNNSNNSNSSNGNHAIWWQWAESLINNANIQETLQERCIDCGFVFSSSSILQRHKQICGPLANTRSQAEFDSVITICREQLARAMLTTAAASLNLSTNILNRENIISSNSSSNNLYQMQSNQIPNVPPRAAPLPPPLSSTGLFSPILNPYSRFPLHTNSSANAPYLLPPPLGAFPPFRLRNLSPSQHSNPYFPSVKPPSLNFSLPKNPINPSETNKSIITENLPNSQNHIPPQNSAFSSQTIQNISETPPKSESNRKRTQIKNYQYDILRSYFNINNPPNDEIISEIIVKTGLDRKTVKHWFRNTLFKERQKCKDSPYNFNIPPETSLNLEEYEKTGKIEIKSNQIIEKQKRSYNSTKSDKSYYSGSPPSKIRKFDELNEDKKPDLCDFNEECSDNVNQSTNSEYQQENRNQQITCCNNIDHYSNPESSSTNPTTDDEETNVSVGEPQINWKSNPSANDLVINKEHSQLIKPILDNTGDLPLDLSATTSIPIVTSTVLNCNSGQDSFNLDPISPFESEHDYSDINGGTNSTSGERRHRTTLTAMQIQAMKSIFIHCRSPSHGELGALGNILSLDMRVVQVWFQNQRAKLKKQERDIYCRDKPTALFPEAVPSIIENVMSPVKQNLDPDSLELSNSDVNIKSLDSEIQLNGSSNNINMQCLVCNQNLHQSISKQVHLFSIGHLTNLMRYLVAKTTDFKVNWKPNSSVSTKSNNFDSNQI